MRFLEARSQSSRSVEEEQDKRKRRRSEGEKILSVTRASAVDMIVDGCQVFILLIFNS